MLRLFLTCFVFALMTECMFVTADDSDESADSSKESFEDPLGEPIKGLGDFFNKAAGNVKEKSETGFGVLRDFSDQAKETAESGVGMMKGIAESFGERFSNAKEKLGESGDKIKEAIGNAALKSKDGFETAASEVSKYAKDASGTLFGFIG